MQIKLWGVRGSLPSPLLPSEVESRIKAVALNAIERKVSSESELEALMKTLAVPHAGGFGGNTACVEVSSDKQNFYIDAGSGLRRASDVAVRGPLGRGQGEAHIFFTHFHWDHLIGLPFFAPVFIPGNKIHVYAVQDELPMIIKTLFKKPFFPVPFEKLGAQFIFHKIDPRASLALDDFSLTPYRLDHPDPCWGYRITRGNKTFSYCVDTECTRASAADLGADLPLYQNVDVMVFDAQYTILDAAERVNWGHAAAAFGLDIAMREGIKKVYFVHHDPAASDERVAEAEAQARDYYLSQLHTAEFSHRKVHQVEWAFAQEGLVIDL